MDVTRRNLIQILGIAPPPVSAQTHAEHAPAAPSAPAKTAYQRKGFDEHQWRAVHALCDLLLPAPGPRDDARRPPPRRAVRAREDSLPAEGFRRAPVARRARTLRSHPPRRRAL